MTTGASVIRVPRFRLARMASTTTPGFKTGIQIPSGSASTGTTFSCKRAIAASGVSARRAVTSSTFVSPNTMAWEKATVRRMAVGAGISVIITDICALFSRRAIPVAKSPAPRMITSMENTPSSTDCRPEPDSPSGAPGPWHLPDSTASPPD
ncbi:Uncharacterised protein [uncultured Blautia sp.]|nr:Uncharacterised protein [uncultured Blautia sp.]